MLPETERGSDAPLAEPRPHHYLYAHRVLPVLFHQRSWVLITVLEQGGSDFAMQVWEDCGRQLLEDPAEHLPPAGITVDCYRQEELVAAIVGLPDACTIAEAHQVCAIARIGRNWLGRRVLKGGRFFTLEYGEGEHGGHRTVFCEWTARGAHLNFGDGPVNEPEAFFAACCQAMRGR